jgi:hypothetical protein
MRWQIRKGFRFENANLIDDSSISISKAPRLRQRGSTAKLPKSAKIIDPEPSLEFGTFIGDRQITLILDIKAANEANHAEPWRKRHARHKGQKKAIFVAMLGYKEIIKLPCILRFTRFAPKSMDSWDNLPMSFKWILDSCCAEIIGDHRPGLADSNKGFTFQYDQVKSKKYYVKIEISW